jgi:glycerophosphoryl diester phosphodiesterase
MLISYLILYYPVWANIQYEKKIPLITAHRGSMWYFPEHTLMAYYYAFFEKSDFIDVDLQPTKDGKFVVYHDPILQEHEVEGLQSFDQTMKIKEPFVNNISKRVYNNGWYVKDFDSEFITSKLMHKMRYGVDQ